VRAWATWAQRTLSAMPSTEPVSAVVVRVPLPARLAGLRAQRDWAASVGVPAHVTVLFPFVPAVRLVPAVRRELAAIGRTVEPFEVRFEQVGRFPGVVYLAPEPAATFSALTAAVHARFPDFPPYEGVFEVVLPHLTITEPNEDEPDEAALDAIAGAAARELPFGARVSRLEVLVEGDDGRWRGRWRISLGQGR
jgi:2'-5' RNA ligase